MDRSNHADPGVADAHDVIIRLAHRDDIAILPQIELSAGTQFRSVNMPEIADDGPPSPDFYRETLAADHLWVAQIGERVGAYGAAEVLDCHVHLEQVSVHADFAGRSIGLKLIEVMCQWARESDFPRATLITFADVPWNAPYYERVGFVEIGADKIGPELAAAFAAERLTDLGRWKRVCMEKRF